MELVLPSNYAMIEEEEMMYLDGGWSITINRRTINSALSAIWSTISGVSTVAWLANKSASAIASKIAGAAWSVAKSLLLKANFGSFLAFSLGGALGGVLIACAFTVGVVYATNSSFRIGF